MRHSDMISQHHSMQLTERKNILSVLDGGHVVAVVVVLIFKSVQVLQLVVAKLCSVDLWACKDGVTRRSSMMAIVAHRQNNPRNVLCIVFCIGSYRIQGNPSTSIDSVPHFTNPKSGGEGRGG